MPSATLEVIDKGSTSPAHPAPLLFVHGAWHAEWCWDEHFLDFFAGRGYRALAPSLRGHGASPATKDSFRKKLREGQLDDKEIEVEISDTSGGGMPGFEVPGMPGANIGMINLNDMLGKAFGGAKTKKVRTTVRESYGVLLNDESDKLLDQEQITQEALRAAENDGIVFLDEIDKIAVSDQRGGTVSREGVQRDLLPLIEGTTVATKHGPMKTDHVLFIASGAFHVSKPSDMLPELQGRLPIRVELRALTEEDFVRILSETRANLVEQYTALIGTEKVTLDITDEAVREVAKIAAQVNEAVENIGARRLQTVMERLLEDISFEAEEHEGETITIDAAYVRERLDDLARDTDLSKYIL